MSVGLLDAPLARGMTRRCKTLQRLRTYAASAALAFSAIPGTPRLVDGEIRQHLASTVMPDLARRDKDAVGHAERTHGGIER